MRTYQMNIRDEALRELSAKRKRLVDVLECPRDLEVPRHMLAKTIFPPVREPSLYGRGNRGSVHCFKAGGLVAHESGVERDFFRIMEWDYTVDTFVAQPFKVPYRRPNGRNSHYTPDCFVMSDSFFRGKARIYEPTAFEIKTKQELEEDWDDLKPKFRAARSFLRESGFRFRLLTEDRIHPVFLTNISFLLNYRGTMYMRRKPNERTIVERFLQVVKQSNSDFTPNYLLSKACDLAPREQLIPWIWNLYADYVFQCDLLTPLTLDTVSWRCGEAARDIANCGFPSKRPDWRQPENDWRR